MWRGIVCGVLAGAFWGAVFIVPVLLPDFSPLELMAGRYLCYLCYGALAAGLMLPRLLPLLLAYGVKLAGVLWFVRRHAQKDGAGRT
ncbi:hypothetical protein [Janthinobacterium sp. JC611]|uniref:hypothetical protein n=1 Tax=Janthinobacterium sp. JC611 TaxID=2816201 RepID=UPI00203D23D8|nr:hypothetical protein [Janthinobacterium sp. JC611]